MMKKIFIFILSIMLLCVVPLSVQARHVPKLSQLEIRDMQTHYFDCGNKEKIFKAAVNTLQDSGFVIQEVNDELGFIRARKIFKEKYTDKKRLAGWSTMLAVTATYTVFSYGTAAGTMIDPTRRIANELKYKTAVVDSNVDIEQVSKNRAKVRFTLVKKVLLNADGYSFVKAAPTKVTRFYSPKIYREFFNQMDKSIFYEGI